MRCVFCVLIEQGTARWVLRQATVAAFAPLEPLAPGHTLVVPTAHHADIFDTPPDVLQRTMELVQRLAQAMRTTLQASGVNILNASGPGSEQSIPHLHFHVVPRWPNDGFSTWPAARSEHKVDTDPIIQLAEALAENDPTT